MQFPDALLVSDGWCKKQREVNLGKHHTEATKQLMSDNHADFRGEKSGMYGRTGNKHPNYGKRGEETSMYGKEHSESAKQLMSENNSMKSRPGELSPLWKGGLSFLPYCIKFNDDFKERVRNFFGRCCYVCGKNEIDNGRKLDVHHVNYDKMVCCNDVKLLFVPLCRSCHGKTSHDREYWEEFFTVSLNYLTNGECFLPKSNSKSISLKYQ